MDQIHRRVLANKTTKIMGRISNPKLFTEHLREILSSSDKEEIAAKESQMGATHATQTMLSILEKRGPRAFPLFITALRAYENRLDDLADELEAEEKRLQGRTADAPMLRAQSLPRSDEPVVLGGVSGAGVYSPPPPYSAPLLENCRAENGNGGIYSFNQVQEPVPASKQPPAAEMNNQAHQELVLSLDTLVKDIPYSLRKRIEMLLDPPDANRHDWRGMAGAMGLTADNVRQLESVPENGKMKGLIERMIQTHRTVNDLLGWLKHPEVERLDVIDEIRKVHNDIPADVLRTETDESSENQQSGATVVTSPVEETCSPEANKSISIPQQECSHDPHKIDSKPDARIPSQVEESDDIAKTNRAQPEVHNNQDSQMQDKDDEEKPDYRMPSQEEKNDSITSNDDDDVFDRTGEVEKQFHALLISCCGNDKEDKKHDVELRNLEEVLCNSSWEVMRQTKCKVSNLIQTVHSFLTKANEHRGIVSFVYLVGPTVQINGENYLLPSDLKSPSTRADLIHCSLNINWLVKQLSKNHMQVVIVDGAHKNTVMDVNLNGVLQGLAPIQPPPNAVIAFTCPPGTIRPEQERLAYIKSVVKNLQEESNIMLTDLFDRVRADMERQSVSSPVEFSLTSSPLPICINPEDNGEFQQVRSLGDTTCHAIIVSNSKYEGLSVETSQCLKDCEQLRMALLKTGWKCEEFCDKPAKVIMDELRNTLNKLADDKKRVVMVYFMGYTKMIMDCNYFFGKDFKAIGSEPLRSSVPLQWALDLMCEKLWGRKILIVDDLNTSSPEGLAEMTTPMDVMISLPKGDNSRQYEKSFTSNFAHLLEAKSSQLTLQQMVERAASFDRHRLSSNLFDSK